MSIRDIWRKTSPNEKWLIAIAALLLVMVATRWERIAKEVSESFGRYFGQ